MNRINITTIKEDKLNNLWRTITFRCKYKQSLRQGPDYGFGTLVYCNINKDKRVSCNSKECQRLKYALRENK